MCLPMAAPIGRLLDDWLSTAIEIAERPSDGETVCGRDAGNIGDAIRELRDL